MSKNPQKQPSKVNPIMRFAGMGGQMLASILLGIYGGKFTDSQLGTEKTWSAVGILLGVGVGLYLVLKDVIRMSKEND